MEARADKGWSSTLEVSLELAPASPFHFGLTSFVMSAPNNNSLEGLISAIGVPRTNRVRIPLEAAQIVRAAAVRGARLKSWKPCRTMRPTRCMAAPSVRNGDDSPDGCHLGGMVRRRTGTLTRAPDFHECREFVKNAHAFAPVAPSSAAE